MNARNKRTAEINARVHLFACFVHFSVVICEQGIVLCEQAKALEAAIRRNLEGLGYGK